MSITLKAPYTWRGKEETATISHYCPVCRTCMELTQDLILTLREVNRKAQQVICCSEECAKSYKVKWDQVDRQIVQHLQKRDCSWVLDNFDALQEQAMTRILNEGKMNEQVSTTPRD